MMPEGPNTYDDYSHMATMFESPAIFCPSPGMSYLGCLAVAIGEHPAALHARLLAELEPAVLTVLAGLQRDHAVLQLAARVDVAVPVSEKSQMFRRCQMFRRGQNSLIPFNSLRLKCRSQWIVKTNCKLGCKDGP